MLTTQKRVALWLHSALVALLLSGWTGCRPREARAMEEGEKLRQQGRAAEAVEPLTQAATLLRTNAQAWNRVGLAAQAAGQVTNALKAYRQALTLARDKDPETMAEVRHNLGCLHLERGDNSSAESELAAYTLLRPKAVDGWVKLGTAQLRARRLDAAERSFAQALALDRHHTEALNGVGVMMLQKRRPRDAYNYFSAALQSRPQDPTALLNLALVAHHYLNLKPLALQKYREYLALDPKPAQFAAVSGLADKLQAELKPPPPPVTLATNIALTNIARATPPPGPSVAATNPAAVISAATKTNNQPALSTPAVAVHAPSPATNTPPANPVAARPTVATNPPVAAVTPPPAPKATNPPVVVAPPVVTPTVPPVVTPPAPVTNLVAAVTNTPPPANEPDIKIEEVTLPAVPEPKVGAALPPEPPPRRVEPAPAEPPPAAPAVTESVPAPSAPASTTPTAQPAATPEKKSGILTKLNPVRWFSKSKEEPKPARSTIPLPNLAEAKNRAADSKPLAGQTNTPSAAPKSERVRQAATEATPTLPPVAPAAEPSVVTRTFPRYKRLSPAAPAAGNRAAAEPLFNLALEAHQKNRWRDAIEGYVRAVSADPSFFEAQHNLALAALNGGEVSRALVAAETALAIRSGAEARYTFALVLQRAGFPLDAAAELETLAKEHPTHAAGHFLLANLCSQDIGDTARARSHYLKVLELEPNHPQAVSIRYWLAAHP